MVCVIAHTPLFFRPISRAVLVGIGDDLKKLVRHMLSICALIRCGKLAAQHSPLAIHTAAFVHVLVLLAAGFALCFGESINLT